MIKKEKKTLRIIEDLIEHNNALYRVLFQPKQFKRTFRKFYKFSASSKTVITMVSKVSGLGIKIVQETDDYFSVTRNKTQHSYWLHAESSKELMQKIIKHNLY